MPPSPPAEVVVTPATLKARPLPDHASVDSKYDRGVVVVVGGSAGTPGAVLLAGLAALRVGAGKIQLATAAGAASGLGIAVPEALAIGVPETPDGALDPAAADRLVPFVREADAVLLGTGSIDVESNLAWLRRLIPEIARGVLVVDAAAIAALAREPRLLDPLDGRAVVMPNPKEMGELLDRSIDDVNAEPEAAATEAIDRLGVTVALRGTTSWTGAPGTPLFRDESGSPGLATAGSGDVLAGAIGGLLARGADPLTATIWAIHLHGAAAARCAARLGALGFLARELLDELPPALSTLGG